MSRNTRSQTAANLRFQTNLASAIHRLPDEVIAHVFITGCPTPNHTLAEQIDVAPFQYQVLVGSICKLWRKISHDCPALWTSVAVRYTLSETKPSKRMLKLYGDVISSVLQRSGTLELDLSIRVDCGYGFWQLLPPYYDQIAPHLGRVHTLDVERQDQFVHWLSHSNFPKLPKLRHFYTKARHTAGGPYIFPFRVLDCPLETFYYDIFIPYDICFNRIPTSRLRYVHIGRRRIEQQVIDFVSGCSNLQVLGLLGQEWERDVILSSSTLTHLDLLPFQLRQLPTRLWDASGLPNLLHLRLRARWVDIYREPFHLRTWAPLPLLRSLSIVPRTSESAQSVPEVANILRCAPQLIALQLAEADALQAIEFLRAHRGDDIDGIRRKPLQLLHLITTHERMQGKWGDLPIIAPALRAWDPDEQTEWHLENCVNSIVIDGVKIRLCAYGVELSPPLSVRADEIAGDCSTGALTPM